MRKLRVTFREIKVGIQRTKVEIQILRNKWKWKDDPKDKHFCSRMREPRLDERKIWYVWTMERSQERIELEREIV